MFQTKCTIFYVPSAPISCECVYYLPILFFQQRPKRKFWFTNVSERLESFSQKCKKRTFSPCESLKMDDRMSCWQMPNVYRALPTLRHFSSEWRFRSFGQVGQRFYFFHSGVCWKNTLELLIFEREFYFRRKYILIFYKQAFLYHFKNKIYYLWSAAIHKFTFNNSFFLIVLTFYRLLFVFNGILE